jgi:hypothetical protein
MEVRPLTTADAEAIAAWRYPGRYSTYDFSTSRPLYASIPCLKASTLSDGISAKYLG